MMFLLSNSQLKLGTFFKSWHCDNHDSWQIHALTKKSQMATWLLAVPLKLRPLAEQKYNKKASIRWQDSASRQFQAELKGDVGL